MPAQRQRQQATKYRVQLQMAMLKALLGSCMVLRLMPVVTCCRIWACPS